MPKKRSEYDILKKLKAPETRPVKQAPLSRLRNNEYAAVVVYKLDCWARSSTELILDKGTLIKALVYFTPDNLIFVCCYVALPSYRIAEFERELIRERTIEGL